MSEQTRTEMDEWLESARAADTSQLTFVMIESLIMANSAFLTGDLNNANAASKRAAMIFSVLAQKMGAGVVIVARDKKPEESAAE